MMGHYPDCISGPPCLVVDDYKKKHNSRPSVGSLRLCRLCAFQKEMIIGKVILEISRKNDVHNNYETDYKYEPTRLQFNPSLDV